MWLGLLGHDAVADHFRRTIAAGRLAATYLFVGPPGVGKRTFALELARSLLCSETDDPSLEACGKCESCRLFAARRHPDLVTIELPPDKTTLPIAAFIGDGQEEGLCQSIALKPFFGRRKVAIVDDADHFSLASANCLLKTLEEPPPSALLILIGTSLARQLPTIRSRSQIVRFAPLDRETVANILIETGIEPKQASRAAELSGGSVERAQAIANPVFTDFRQVLLRELASADLESVRLGRNVQAFVDESGKEASQRRDRLRVVIGFALDHFRERLRDSSNAAPNSAIHALDACLSSLEYIDRNANLATVIQNWCEQLAGATRGELPSA